MLRRIFFVVMPILLVTSMLTLAFDIEPVAPAPPDGCGWPVLVAAVQISSNGGYSVGDTLTARFTVQNQGTAAIHLDKLLFGGRFNGGTLPGGGFPDFSYSSVTLQVGQTYQYEGTLYLTEAGYYQFFVAYYIANPTDTEKQLLDPNNWNTCIDLAPGLSDSDRTWSKEMRIYGIPPDFGFLTNLQYGDNNPKVRYLQILLNIDPYTRVASSGDGSPGSETCSFGDLTRNAVKKFQEKYGLTETGIADGLTRTKLNQILAQKFSQQVKDEFGLLDLEQRKSIIWSDIGSYESGYPDLSSFPRELVLAIASTETGEGAHWNNEHVSYDWGRGIMQITFDGYVGAGGVDSSSEDCLKARDRIAYPLKTYSSKYYSNTPKGIEANIKDGLYALAGWWRWTSTLNVQDTGTYSSDEIKMMLTVHRYGPNRGTQGLPVHYSYVQAVGGQLVQLADDERNMREGGGYDPFPEFDIELATSLGAKLRDADDLLVAYHSPVELCVFDGDGGITGVVNGEIREEIPNSFYDSETETVVIFLLPPSIHCEIEGKETGIYGLDVVYVENGTETAFGAVEITTSLNATHQYTFNWTALSQDEEGVDVQVDSDGDGVFEYAFASDNELTRHEFAVATNGHDTGITEIVTPKNVLGEGYGLLTNVTVVNYGAYSETSNITLYVNETLAESQTITLVGGNTTTVTFTLDTSGLARGNYTVSAYAWPVLNETYTDDNLLVGGWIQVSIAGDLNGDFTVDIYDAILLAGAYNSVPMSMNWKPNADINGDNIVDIYDAIILANHYNQHYP